MIQNVMEKIINDIITLSMFNILKLLGSYYFVHLSYFPTFNICIEWFGESHFRSTEYKMYVRLDLTLFHFSSYLCFILLHFMS